MNTPLRFQLNDFYELTIYYSGVSYSRKEYTEWLEGGEIVEVRTISNDPYIFDIDLDTLPEVERQLGRVDKKTLHRVPIGNGEYIYQDISMLCWDAIRLTDPDLIEKKMHSLRKLLQLLKTKL